MAVLILTQMMIFASCDLCSAGLISYAYLQEVSLAVLGKVWMTGVSPRPRKPGSIKLGVHQSDVKDYRVRMANGPEVA